MEPRTPLERYRIEEGLTYQELAERLGIARGTAHLYATGGRNTSQNTRDRIAKATDGRVRPEDWSEPARSKGAPTGPQFKARVYRKRRKAKKRRRPAPVS